MALTSDAHCYQCDYHEQLFIGPGRSNFQTYCSWPARCDICSKVVCVNAYAGSPTCPDCGSIEVKLFEDAMAFNVDDAKWDELRNRNISRRGGNPHSSSHSDKAIISWSTRKLSKLRFGCPKCDAPELRFGTDYMGSPIMLD